MIPKEVDDLVRKQFISECDRMQEDIFMSELFSTIFECAEKATVKDYKGKPLEDALYAAFKEGHEVWRETAHFLNNAYNQDFSDMGFLLAMESFFGSQENQAGHNALVKFLENDLGVQFFDDVNHEIKMDPETMDQYIDKADPNLLHQFFLAFQDLGEFHRNPEEYTDPEQYNKYMKLMALYTKLMHP